MESRACNRSDCRCPHLDCYNSLVTRYVKDKGYNEDGTTKEYEKPVTYPCRVCNPERYEIFTTSKNSEEYIRRMNERKSKSRSQYYEEYEEEKTRVF